MSKQKNDFFFSVLSLFLVAACLCLIESRSHGNAKINALIKRLEKAWDSRFDDDAVPDQVGGHVGCDWEHTCVNGCCPYPAGNGNDGDFVCCAAAFAPTTCASSKDACESNENN